jgi:alkanesulfonate monooxygenase SsuD/methylene tetrahydromethanopterin reductase-like flavin-dependent oxidoreductase (luciferase family)
LGLGWSKDELDSTGANMKERGPMADEFLQILTAIWTQNPVEFHGKFHTPLSYIDLKAVQKRHPRIYLAAFAPAALKRLARLADGWNPTATPVEGMAQAFSSIKQMAVEAGRDPSRSNGRSRESSHYGKTVGERSPHFYGHAGADQKRRHSLPADRRSRLHFRSRF